MKRVKESGAFFRKKKKAKEAELKKYEGAILKFVTSSDSNVSLTIPENDSNENPDNNVDLQKYTEEISLSAKTQETRSIQTDTNEINYVVPVAYGDEGENNDEAIAIVNNLPNDVASWPEIIDHQLRVELVKAGPEKYQNRKADLLPATEQLKLEIALSLSEEVFPNNDSVKYSKTVTEF